MESKRFPFFDTIPYIAPDVYLADENAEYFTAYGEWDIVRLGDGSFAYTKLDMEEE